MSCRSKNRYTLKALLTELFRYSHQDVDLPLLLREWQEHEEKIDERRIWRHRVVSGKYFSPKDNILLPNTLGEMEIGGLYRATAFYRSRERRVRLGAISAITEIFDTDGFVVDRYTATDKSGLASCLTKALQQYLAFRKAGERDTL